MSTFTAENMEGIDLSKLVARSDPVTRAELAELLAAIAVASAHRANAEAADINSDRQARQEFMAKTKDAFVKMQGMLLGFTFVPEEG